jgi:hypothetical protein
VEVKTMVIQCLQWLGDLLTNAYFPRIGWISSPAPPLRFRWSGWGSALIIPLLLVGTTLVGRAGPIAAPPGFPLVPPAPPPAPAIGSRFVPTQFLATSSLPTGGWPGPALSAFPWIEINRTGATPGSLTATDPVLEAMGLNVPSLRMDRLVIRTPHLGFAWPTAQSGRVGGQLWLVFGNSPLGPNLILQGPRAFPSFAGAPLGSLVTVSPVMTPGFFFVNAPPKSYAFDIILTDLDGVVRDVLDPLMIVGGVPPNMTPTFPIAHWILEVPPGQPVRRSLPPETALALRKLGVALRRGSPSFVPSSRRLCPTEPPAAGLPPLLKLDLETGELSASTVAAVPGTYCATYDAHSVRKAKVAELAIIVTVLERLSPGDR